MFAAEAHIKYNNACVSLMSIDRGHLEYKQPLSILISSYPLQNSCRSFQRHVLLHMFDHKR